MNFPREGKPEMEGEHNKVVFHPATMQFGLVVFLLGYFFCVHRRDAATASGQTNCISEFHRGVDDREVKKPAGHRLLSNLWFFKHS